MPDKRKLWISAVIVILTLASLACTIELPEINVDQGEIEKVATEVVTLVEDAGELYEEGKPRVEIIARATEWVVKGIPYGSLNDGDPSNDYQDGYRADAGGLVSYAWKLEAEDGSKLSVDPVGLSAYTTQIAFDDLQSGDIINNQRAGDLGHVVIFVSWVPATNSTMFVALEQNPDEGKAVQTNLLLQDNGDGTYTLRKYDSDMPGPYVAQRLNELVALPEE